MDSVIETIIKNNLFKKNEKIGVACSGGSDSICLLHLLNKNKDLLGIEVFAINIDHQIRENSQSDSLFVKEFCEKFSIPLFFTKVDCLKEQEKSKDSSLENVARKLRYNFFNSLLDSGKVDKICLAHHQNDQAETILLNIFRGSGINGAKGMDIVSGKYVRPLLNNTKDEILEYLKVNELKYVTDETNLSTDYTRNFLRLLVVPLLETRFPKVQKNICSFGKKCKQDNDFINSIIKKQVSGLEYKGDYVYLDKCIFENEKSIINRCIYETLKYLNSTVDIETKHYDIIISVFKDEKVNKAMLPNDLICEKDRQGVVIYKKNTCDKEYNFTTNEINYNNYCKILCEKSCNSVEKGKIKFDLDKIPSSAVWRKRRSGDIFHKVNGSEKKLKDFLVEKRISNRNKDLIPVLANGNEILICGNIEIAESIKISENSKKIYEIMIDKNFKE